MEAGDEELMLAYRDGNAGAFETLYTRHRGRLYRFVLRSVKARGMAEELFQEVWMRVIEARSRYTPQARFTTWLYTIAHNLLTDRLRPAHRQAQRRNAGGVFGRRTVGPRAAGRSGRLCRSLSARDYGAFFARLSGGRAVGDL